MITMRLASLLALASVLAVASASNLYINCGGNALSNYVADSQSFRSQSGSAVKFFFGKSKGAPDTVYDTHSFANGGQDLVYSFNVRSGSFRVKLMFAENWSGGAQDRGRIINVDINGERVATELDVWVAAGRRLYSPYNIVRNGLEPRNGQITIRISSVKQNAFISGIEIIHNRGQNLTPKASPAGKPVSVKPPSTTSSGTWRTVSSNGQLNKRHEACSVMVNGKVFLIGGRMGKKTVDVYTPATKTWTSKAVAPYELHHMQCAVYKNRYIYIVGAWFGGFPNEKTHDKTYVYDTTNNKWHSEPGLGERARGGGAAVFYKGLLYYAMGNRGGHGSQATTLGEFDVYNPETKVWSSLPTAPDARDHVGGGIIRNYFCIAGGRNGGVSNFWNTPVTRVNCYNFNSRKWERKAHLPEGRAGAATGTTCDGLLMIAGGEGIPEGEKGKAFDRVDLYDVVTNTFRKPSFLKKGRHGTGLAISDCSCGNIYYPSGSGVLGGGQELTTMEVWRMSGGAQDNC